MNNIADRFTQAEPNKNEIIDELIDAIERLLPYVEELEYPTGKDAVVQAEKVLAKAKGMIPFPVVEE